MPVTVRDLPISTLKSGAILYCEFCGEESSATRGDYFMLPDDYEFICQTCSIPMELVRKGVSYETFGEASCKA